MSGWTVFKLFVLLLVFVAALGVDVYWLSTAQPEYVARQAIDQFKGHGESIVALRQYDMAKGCLTASCVALAAACVLFAGDVCRACRSLFAEKG